MLTIIDDHVVNHFTDKFVFPCHVDYLINGNRRKLTDGYIYFTFYTSKTKFCIFIFEGRICQQIIY